MSLDEVGKLTDAELRMRVAELLGWRAIDAYSATGIEPWLNIVWDIPDYPRDLEACHHAMENTLEGEERNSFAYLLSIIVGEGTPDYRWNLTHATARWRCEAFVATKGRIA